MGGGGRRGGGRWGEVGGGKWGSGEAGGGKWGMWGEVGACEGGASSSATSVVPA